MQEQSFQAKLVKECIRLAAGNRLIGPKIKMGELQRHLVDKEPLWRKPEDMGIHCAIFIEVLLINMQ